MKQLFNLSILLIISTQSYGQLVLSAEGIKPDNACNPNSVYFLMERKAKPIEPIDSIEMRINNSINLKNTSKNFNAKPSLQCVINCNGELGGGFHMVIKSGDDKLDDRLIEFFKSITDWTAGRKNKKKTVDSWYMWRMEIKDGYINILN